MKRLCAVLSLMWVSMNASVATAEEASFHAPKHLVPGRGILKLRGIEPERLAIDAEQVAALQAIEKRVGARIIPVRPMQLGWGLYEIHDVTHGDKVLDEAATMALLTRMASDPFVLGAVEDRWYRRMAVPNDPYYSQMWHLTALGMADSWDITQGSTTQRIGVVDTGTLRAHEDLVDKDLAGYDFISDRSTAADGSGRDSNWNDPGDAANCGAGWEESSFHGTHVAATILASANNGVGIPGINWNAKLVTARVLGRCGGSLSDIGEAAYWLAGGSVANVPDIGANKVSVINVSLGGEGACSAYEREIIDYANSQGVIYVAAAGNEGGAVGSPGNCSGVITVAAHGPGSSRRLASYSNFGSTVEIVAPGGAITTSDSQGILSAVGPDSDGYTWMEGTSMATPHVVGAVSLMLAVDPTLTRDDIVSLMQTHGVSCTNCQGKKALKLSAVLQALGAPVVDPDPPPSNTSPEDSYEENDTFETARSINCGADLPLFMAPSEMDWFSVAVPAGQTLTAVIDAETTGQDIDLYVSRAAGASGVLGSSESTTGHERVQVVSTGGTLRVGVNSYQGATSRYRLQVTCEPTTQESAEVDPVDGNFEKAPDDDTAEPNNDRPTATRMSCGRGGTFISRDVDVFAIRMEQGHTLRVTSSADQARQLELLDEEGGFLGVTEMAPGEDSASKRDLPGGYIFLRVTTANGDGAEYTLQLDCAAPEANEGVTSGCSQSSPLPAPLLALALLLLRRRR
ncbi:MAG: S8 family peptidase [Myxococcota bacterium]